MLGGVNIVTEWLLRLICCGRDDGVERFGTWSEADRFRESYCSGPGVLQADRPQYGGHDRAAILYGPFTSDSDKVAS